MRREWRIVIYIFLVWGLVMPGYLIYKTIQLIMLPHKIQIIGRQTSWNAISTYAALAFTGVLKFDWLTTI